MRALYGAIRRVTGRQQLLLILLSLLVAAMAALPLKFQQLIVNGLVEHGQVATLAWQCLGFLGAVLLSLGLKFVLGLRQATVGERTVLLIRERLYANAVADAALPGHEPQRGTLLAMLAAEAEMVGSFAGAAISTPLVQIGTLLSVLGFIALSSPRLGLLALAVVLPQALIVVGVQARINRGVQQRVQALRSAAERISASDLARVEDEVLADFHAVFEARRQIFLLKLSSKLALGAVSNLGKVGILFLGGWLVLEGRGDVGTVVATLTGLTRIEGPWRDLVSFFRTLSTVRVKYEMLARALLVRGVPGVDS
ncbi:MAG: ABC transporter transmembrane domain-containing protein [Geminicoccaceae bacterium]